MKKSTVKLILIEVILFISIVIFNLFNIYTGLVKIILWNAFMIVCYFILGFPKDKNYYKSYAIRIVLISLFATLIMIYAIGMFTGFSNNIFDLSLLSIIENITPIVLVIVPMEIIRYIYAKYEFKNKWPIIILMVGYIILNITMEISHYNMLSAEGIFKYICVVVFPTIATEMLCTYLTSKVSIVPSLIYKLAMNLYIYIFPFFPSLGEYISCVINVVLPFMIYLSINKLLKYNDKKDYSLRKNLIDVVCIPLLVFLILIVILVSGIFDYKMIAIGSNSMYPLYERGDAVIYKKIKDISDINKGDILVFQADDMIITHRVVDIKQCDNKVCFITKGDNNNGNDNYTITIDNSVGIVKYYVKYIGLPTIWLNENK